MSSPSVRLGVVQWCRSLFRRRRRCASSRCTPPTDEQGAAQAQRGSAQLAHFRRPPHAQRITPSAACTRTLHSSRTQLALHRTATPSRLIALPLHSAPLLCPSAARSFASLRIRPPPLLSLPLCSHALRSSARNAVAQLTATYDSTAAAVSRDRSAG